MGPPASANAHILYMVDMGKQRGDSEARCGNRQLLAALRTRACLIYVLAAALAPPLSQVCARSIAMILICITFRTERIRSSLERRDTQGTDSQTAATELQGGSPRYAPHPRRSVFALLPTPSVSTLIWVSSSVVVMISSPSATCWCTSSLASCRGRDSRQRCVRGARDATDDGEGQLPSHAHVVPPSVCVCVFRRRSKRSMTRSLRARCRSLWSSCARAHRQLSRPTCSTAGNSDSHRSRTTSTSDRCSTTCSEQTDGR